MDTDLPDQAIVDADQGRGAPETPQGGRVSLHAKRRTVIAAIVGVGLGAAVLFHLTMRQAIDKCSIEEVLREAEAAGGNEAEPVRSSRRIRQSQGVDAMAFSSDGRYFATGGRNGVVNVWSTADWSAAGAFEQKGRIKNLAFSPDGRSLHVVGGTGRDDPIDCYVEWRTGKTEQVPPDQAEQVDETASYEGRRRTFTNGGKFAISMERRDGSAGGHEVYLECRELDGSRKILGDARFLSLRDDEVQMDVLTAENQIAVVSGDVWLRIYRLPRLQLLETYEYPLRGSRYSSWGSPNRQVKCVRYSPDGKWVAVAQDGRPTPRLFSSKDGTELIPYDGHGDRVLGLWFADDDRTLRSLGDDGTICTWDAADLKMLARVSLPTDPILGKARPLGDRYMVYQRGREVHLRKNVNVLDLTTGTCLCEVVLPVDARTLGNLFWVNDPVAVCVGRGEWHRFNYRTGKVLGTGAMSEAAWPILCGGAGELTEDGKTVFYVHDAGKNTPPWTAETVDLDTLAVTKLGEFETRGWPNGRLGLVPGGKYFHIGSQIFDRRTLQLVAARDFAEDDAIISVMAFSPDGSRYAALLRRDHGQSNRGAIVYVHETLTRRMFTAFAPQTLVEQFRFSHDGTRLAIAYDDGTLELRRVSADPTK
jgi:WD40 repeat protein